MSNETGVKISPILEEECARLEKMVMEAGVKGEEPVFVFVRGTQKIYAGVFAGIVTKSGKNNNGECVSDGHFCSPPPEYVTVALKQFLGGKEDVVFLIGVTKIQKVTLSLLAEYIAHLSNSTRELWSHPGIALNTPIC